MKNLKSLNTNYKKSFTLLELILSITILSVVVINTLQLQKTLIKDDKTLRQKEVLKLDLLATKIYLQKNMQNLNDLELEDEKLYFNDILILKEVSQFEKYEDENYFYIKLTLNKKIKNSWVIKR